jgi:hypothetical protein
MDLYETLLAKRFTIEECPYPCSFTRTSIRDKNTQYSAGKTQFIFSNLVKTTKSRFSYRELELLAEFGGYVGLFLGISVFNLREVFGKIIKLISCP